MTAYETVEGLEICEDCVLLINGYTPSELNSEEADRADRVMTAIWDDDGWQLHENWPEDDEYREPWFSWQSCDGCNSGLGGNRYPAVAMREKV